jgi:DNA-binding NarL/FixJ family response regulator
VVVVGESGVGKSRLLDEAIAHARRRGVRTVRALGTRSTATIPFGAFAAWVPEDFAVPVTDRLRALHGIVRGLVADHHPGRVVVAVDDAHLLDEGSAALVLHLASETGATVLAALRSGEACPDAVTALWKDGLAERLDIGPLPEAAVAELSEAVLGDTIDAAARRRLGTLCGGRPLYLREVLRAARSQQVLVRDAGGWRWKGQLSGCARLGDLLADRLTRLPAAVRRALEVVAVAEPVPLAVVAELGWGEALAEGDRRGLLTLEAGPGPGPGRGPGPGPASAEGAALVRLAHPLYAEVLRSSATPLVTSDDLRALARAAETVGWHEVEPLRVALWWVDSGDPGASAGVLLAGAHRALVLADWALAERLARAAEAAGGGGLAALARASALVHLGGWSAANTALEQLAVDELDDATFAEVARFRSGLLVWGEGNFPAGQAVLRAAAARVGPPVRARVLAEAANITVFAGDPAEASRLAVEAMNDSGTVVDTRVQAMAVAALAWTMRGRSAAALQAVECIWPHVRLLLAAHPYPSNPAYATTTAHCMALVLQGRLREAATHAAVVLDDLPSGEVQALRAATSAAAARVALLQGHLQRAQQHARQAVLDAGAGPGSHWAAATLARAAAQSGDVATAIQTLGDVAAGATPRGPIYANELDLAHAWVDAAEGRLGQAAATARAVAAATAASGLHLLEMLALVDLVRIGAAADAVCRLAVLADRMDGAYARVASSFATAAATGDGAGLDAASGALEGVGATLLAAEAAAMAATTHRDAARGSSYRASLTRARALAARCEGARTPALLTIDLEPGVRTLTRREREVLELAARGLTNREIAADLHISNRTVHAHLCNGYVKLGTNDRTQLAAILARGV